MKNFLDNKFIQCQRRRINEKKKNCDKNQLVTKFKKKNKKKKNKKLKKSNDNKTQNYKLKY